MGNTSDVDYKAIAVGSITALGGLATIGVTFFYIIRPGEVPSRFVLEFDVAQSPVT